MKIRFAHFLCLAVILGCFTPVYAKYTREIERTFDVSPDGNLEVTTSGGDIKVVSDGGRTVRVLARQVFHQADSESEAEREAENLEFSIEQEGNTVTALSKYRRTASKWFSWGQQGVTVSFTVSVPSYFNVKANTSGGDIRVSDLEGKVVVRTSGGDIDLGRVGGEVDAVTSGGDIMVEGGQGQIKVVTSGGDIRVNAAAGDVHASTSGGNVHLDEVEGVVNASTSGGNVYARFASALSHDANLSTSGGNVSAWLAGGSGVFLDASTSGGKVRTDGLKIDVEKGGPGKDRLVGAVNGGGPRLKLRTSGGNIQVKSS